MLHGRRQYQPRLVQSFTNKGSRIDDVLYAIGQVKKDVGINGEELGPVWVRRQ